MLEPFLSARGDQSRRQALAAFCRARIRWCWANQYRACTRRGNWWGAHETGLFLRRLVAIARRLR